MRCCDTNLLLVFFFGCSVEIRASYRGLNINVIMQKEHFRALVTEKKSFTHYCNLIFFINECIMCDNMLPYRLFTSPHFKYSKYDATSFKLCTVVSSHDSGLISPLIKMRLFGPFLVRKKFPII